MTAPQRVKIFDVEAERAATIAESLTALGLVASVWSRPIGAVEALRRDAPALAILVQGDAFPGLVEAARAGKIATLAAIEPGSDPIALAARVRGFDGWVSLAEVARELPVRVLGLLEPGGPSPGAVSTNRTPVIDHRFLALVIHDLRTPLNVIGLTIRTLTHQLPQRSPEVEEDLTYLHENAKQIEKMLAQLADFCRLIEGESQISALEFEPHRYLSDFLEEFRTKPWADLKPVRLEFGEGSPSEVALDPPRVRLALQYALVNAINASGESPVKIRSTGGSGRWVIELIVDVPPPQTVESVELHPEKFERLAGTYQERRGLDLALVARVSQMFGGSAKLVAEPGRRTTIVLDWPERLGKS